MYNPSLDGSELIQTYDNGTGYISDNMLQGTKVFLSDGWDNSGDWMLTLEYFFTGADGEGILIAPTTNTGGLQNGQPGIMLCNYGQGFGLSSRSSTWDGTTRMSSRISGWQTLTVTKTGDSFEITTYDTTLTKVNSLMGSTGRCMVGIERWNQGTVKIKNIKVTSL